MKQGMWVLAPWLLAGCGSDGSTATESRLDAVAVETVPAGSDALKQTQLRRYRYASTGEGATMVAYSDPGADEVWGTADDKPAFRADCAYGQRTGETPRDMEVELSMSQMLKAAETSVTGSIMLSILGIPLPTLHGERYCLAGYHGQNAVDEQVYALGADGQPSTGDDIREIWLRWSRDDADGQKSTLMWQGLRGGNAQAPEPVPLTRFYYPATASGAFRYLVSTDAQTYYKYEFDASGRLKARQAWTYAGEAKSWPGEQAGDIAGVRLTFSYAGDRVDICETGPTGAALSHRDLSVTGGLVRQRREFAAGPDGLACTADDVVTRRESYRWL